MIGSLRSLARRREVLVALSDAQRALLALEVRSLRQRDWLPQLGRIAPRLVGGGAIGSALLLALLALRPRGLVKLASAALALYPLMRRLLAILRPR
ncbi:MAG: hypothetical protein IT532_02735 [Burkholderiales bacterium]|nr:hypothetical protein [Burkholderiales bacterium]